MRRYACWAGCLGVLALAAPAGARTAAPMATWTDDPCTTATINWERDAAARGLVYYGLTTNYGLTASDSGAFRRHVITLRNLMPGQTYHYKVVSADGYDSGDGYFRTAPATNAPLNFCIHGDLQGGCNASAARDVITRIRDEAPDLVISPGDLCDEEYGSGPATWENFVNLTTDLLARTVYMPTAGNHDLPENGSACYWQNLALPPRPGAGAYYSFNRGGVHFTALLTDGDIPAQTNWLMRDLQAAMNDTNINWIIPYFHRPPYSWGERAGDDWVKTNWCKLFTQYGVDLVVSGHSHNYQRTVPIRGVRYIVVGGGGASLYYTTFTPGSHESATTCYHFVSIQTTGSVMKYRMLRSDGVVFEDIALTNYGRTVRFSPSFPQRGGTVRISYDASRGPLAGVSPVYIHIGYDAWAAVGGAAMTFNAGTGRWEYDYAIPVTASSRVVCCFRDSASSIWDNNYTYNWQALLERTTVNPAMPTAGTAATVQYDPLSGPLASAGTIYARVGFDNWTWTNTWDLPLTNNPATGRREAVISIPAWARQFDCAFYSGSAWDHGDGIDWHCTVSGATSQPPWIALPLLSGGSPLIGTNPPVVQNNPGDNVDFNTNGTPLTSHNAGFGSFGQLYFNYDASNLYVGGVNASLGGTNNVFILFLGLDTLSDNAFNLWHKSGLPNALDYLHNVSFREPMDIAIILGNEYADGVAYTNFTHGGYNFGQGIWYIGTNSSAFVAVAGAQLAQFDNTNFIPCVTDDDDANPETERWEASLPWSALNAPSNFDSIGLIHAAGVIASDSVTGNDRYLSATYLGRSALGTRDSYGQFAKNFVVLDPVLILRGPDDYDNDTLPNQWEHEHFASAQGPAPAEDQDGDGSPNGDEYVAGTQPTNSASYFAAQTGPAPAGGLMLTWPGATGRYYAVYRGTNLNQAFTPLATNLQTSSFTTDVTALERAYYSIRVRPK